MPPEESEHLETLKFTAKPGELKSRKLIYIPKSLGDAIDPSKYYRVTITPIEKIQKQKIISNTKSNPKLSLEPKISPEPNDALSIATKTYHNINNSQPFSEKRMLVSTGDYVVTHIPEKYHMVGIGSCLGIFLFDIQHNVYAMAHCVFPNGDLDQGKMILGDLPAKFCDIAILSMLKEMKNEYGSRQRLIKAKLIGGSNIIDNNLNVGKYNIETAQQVLQDLNIEIIAQEVGGKEGRTILEFHRDGTILLRKGSDKFKI